MNRNWSPFRPFPQLVTSLDMADPERPMKLQSFSPLLRWAAAGSLLLMADTSLAQTTGALPQDPAGEWLVDKKIARIRIADCGDGHMWGVVSWEAKPGVDH